MNVITVLIEIGNFDPINISNFNYILTRDSITAPFHPEKSLSWKIFSLVQRYFWVAQVEAHQNEKLETWVWLLVLARIFYINISRRHLSLSFQDSSWVKNAGTQVSASSLLPPIKYMCWSHIHANWDRQPFWWSCTSIP